MDCIDDVCNDHHKGIPSLNGQEALENIKKQDIDLVILDIMMADMDGFEVLRRIREMDKEIPVIFLSARQEEYDKVLGLFIVQEIVKLHDGNFYIESKEQHTEQLIQENK